MDEEIVEVVQVCPSFHPYLGGIETHVKEISKRLTAMGLTVKVYTTDPSGNLPKKEIIEGIETFRFSTLPPKRFYYFSPKLYAALRKLKEADVIHVHSYPEFPSLAAALAKKSNKKPLMLTPHYWGSKHVIGTSRWLTLAKEAYNLLLGKFALSKFDAVAAVSKYEKEILVQKLGLNERKVTYIPNGIDVRKFSGAFRKNKDTKTILYVGRLEKYKGISFLINAFPKLKSIFPDLQLIIVGKGSYKKELTKLAGALNVQNSIKFMQNVPEEQLTQLYSSSRIFVSLSQYESLPMTLLEAMTYGLPIIATNVGGTSEIIQPYKTGFLLDFPPDEKALVKTATSLLENAEYSAKIGLEAKNLVLSKFSWDSVVRDILGCYKKILD